MKGEQGRGSPEAAGRFRRRLADLKRNGCNVLLVGTDALDAGCERLLGESSAGPRYRLFVTTDARPSTARARLASVQPGPYRDSAAVVNWSPDVRETADDSERTAADPGKMADDSGKIADDSDRSGGWDGSGVGEGCGGPDGVGRSLRRTSVESGDLGDLGREVEAAIDSFEAEAGDLSPAELRLCVDSLTLVDEYDDRAVRRFLLGLTETVERVDGMGHYHLPAGYDSETVAAVEPLFDAVVELRRAEGRVEQRWHLADPELATRWLAL